MFNWLYARHTGGAFILRIEDTNTDSSKPELVDAIRESLTWLGLDWDEEYLQSERFDLYLKAANDLLESGKAYRCDCTPEDVKARAEARGESASGGYDGHCRDRNVPAGEGVAIRFATPKEGVTGWDDVIRGRVEFENSLLEDFIIVRSSGVPMFHVANAYDDYEMGITHVVRGEDLVNTTPRVLLLREAMGATSQPVYAHLPLIVNERRKKLSKRRDDVSVSDYADRGYLPEAMSNYLATLGWGPEDGVEVRPIQEIIGQFELSDIGKAPAFFDIKKLDHFNGEYIRALPQDEFIARTWPLVDGTIDRELYERLAPELQIRAKQFSQVPSFLDWVVGDAPEPSGKDWRKVMRKDNVAEALGLIIERLADAAWEPDELERIVFGVGEELETRTQVPVRLAVTGVRSGLPLFEPMAAVDRGVILDRLRVARERIAGEE